MRELEIEGTKVAVALESDIGFLGAIEWSYVPEMYVPFEQLEDLFTKEGIPEDARPRRTRPIDAFKAAVRSVQNREYSVEYETYIDPTTLAKKTDSRSMLVVQRVHDQQIDALPVAMKVSYDEKYQTLTFAATGRAPGTTTSAMEAAIADAFQRYRTSYTAEDVRAMINRALRRAYASVLKASGGIYFVPEKHRPELESIARVVEQLAPAEMVATPVVDREPERKTILKRYEKATLERIEELMLQVRETVQAGEAIVPSAYKRVLDELEYLREQKGKYEELLDTAMGKVDVEMQVLASELIKLGDLVKESK